MDEYLPLFMLVIFFILGFTLVFVRTIGNGLCRVIIGHENPDPDLHDLALVTAGYLEGETGWGLGVLGSTRMEYARVMSLVDHVARSLAHALEERRP